MALTIPYRFANTQVIDASRFNSDFDAIVAWATTVDTDLAAAAADIIAVETSYANVGKGAFFAYQATDQSISGVIPTKLAMADTGTNAFDTNSYFASSAYTPLIAGAYQLNVVIKAKDAANFNDAAEYITVYIGKNGIGNLIPLMTLIGVGATTGSASIVLKANGTTDSFAVYTLSNKANEISYVYFSGCCVKPD